MLKIELKKKILHSFIKLYGLFKGIEKKVVFVSYGGKQYSDNPRAISEKMHDLYPDYKIVWGLNSLENKYRIIPEYVEAVPVKSISFFKHFATACCYIQNEAMSESVYKRKGQFFIQTWHGDRGIKKILYDAWGEKERPTPVMDNKITDLFIVGSDYAEKRIGTAFRYNGEVLKVGMPRNDKLIYPIGENIIKRRLNIDLDVNILLYAPTLRKNASVVSGMVDLQETMRHLENRGGRWICLVRAHPKSLGLDVEHNEKIIDVSQYPDMADLLIISDMLITDYSSCAGDFILRRKPIILAQFDLEQYMQEDRTFYVDINEIGYLIARNQEELNHYIDTMSDKAYEKNCDDIMQYFGTCETGNSAEQICELINENYLKWKECK